MMGAGSSGAFTVKSRTIGATDGTSSVDPALLMVMETMCPPVTVGVNLSW